MVPKESLKSSWTSTSGCMILKTACGVQTRSSSCSLASALVSFWCLCWSASSLGPSLLWCCPCSLALTKRWTLHNPVLLSSLQVGSRSFCCRNLVARELQFLFAVLHQDCVVRLVHVTETPRNKARCLIRLKTLICSKVWLIWLSELIYNELVFLCTHT